MLYLMYLKDCTMSVILEVLRGLHNVSYTRYLEDFTMSVILEVLRGLHSVGYTSGA